MGFESRYSKEQRAEIKARFVAGERLPVLCADFKCTQAALRYILKKQGIDPNRGRTFPSLDETQRRDVERLRSEGLSLPKVAAALDLPLYRVRKFCEDNGLSAKVPRRGPDSNLWRGGTLRRKSHRYTYVWLPHNDPMRGMALKTGHVAEHRLVMARSLGRLLGKTETVHHINGDPSDNRLENLQLRQGKHGTGAAYACLDCGSHNVIPVPLAG